jgi:hypothetical protein
MLVTSDLIAMPTEGPQFEAVFCFRAPRRVYLRFGEA